MAREPTRTADGPVDFAERRFHAPQSLWQLPVFIAGVSALVAVWVARPLWRDSESQRWLRDLATVRRAVTESPADADRAAELAERLLAAGPPLPDRAAEFHFLCGSAFLLRSRAAPASLASESLKQALEHLSRAAELGVPPADQAKLDYRLARVWFLSGADPHQVIRRLEAGLGPDADDPFEGYGMLARAYLRLPVPNPTAALEATKKQLASRAAKGELLAPARLLHAELLLQLHKPEEARQMLARLGTDAPPALAARARALRAESCQQLDRWDEAAQLWEAALADAAFPPANPARARYYLGVCHQRRGKRDEARQAWERLLPVGGEEGQAAAFALAELDRKGSAAADSVRHFERGLATVASAGDYRNTLLGLAEARRMLEEACHSFRERQDFEDAAQLARLLERIAPAGVAAEQRALTHEAWASRLRAEQRPDEARKHLVEAGASFGAAAEASTDPAARARWLRRSADCLIEADDRARAIVALKKHLAFEPSPASAAEAWFALARVYEGPDDGLAMQAYRKCIEYDTPLAFRARYRLAEMDIAHRNFDDAQKTLEQSLQLMRGTADEAVHERTLFALADLLYDRGNYRLAKSYYQEALERYPNRDGDVRARLRLADCHQRLAVLASLNLRGVVAPSRQLYDREQYRQELQAAAGVYEKLSADLVARRQGGALPKGDEAALRQADFALLECQVNLGRYGEAVRLCESLGRRYDHRIEHLRALRQLWRCYQMTEDPQKAQKAAATLQRVRALLQEMDARQFPASPDADSRDEWRRWLQEHSQPQPAPGGRPVGGSAIMPPSARR